MQDSAFGTYFKTMIERTNIENSAVGVQYGTKPNPAFILYLHSHTFKWDSCAKPALSYYAQLGVVAKKIKPHPSGFTTKNHHDSDNAYMPQC